jgi:hypothetical protein
MSAHDYTFHDYAMESDNQRSQIVGLELMEFQDINLHRLSGCHGRWRGRNSSRIGDRRRGRCPTELHASADQLEAAGDRQEFSIRLLSAIYYTHTVAVVVTGEGVAA